MTPGTRQSQPPPSSARVAVAGTRPAKGVAFAAPFRRDTNRGPQDPCGIFWGSRLRESYVSAIPMRQAMAISAPNPAQDKPLVERQAVGSRNQLWKAAAWWRGLDSNQRRRAPTDLQSVPFSLSGTPPRGTAPLGPNQGHCQRARHGSQLIHAGSARHLPHPRNAYRG